MAETTPSQQQSSRRGAQNRAPRIDSGGSTSSVDAVELLKSDHRQVEAWFEDFENSDDDDERIELAGRICKALTVHTQIEEELFYPAFLEATDEEDLHHEAIIEHEGAKRLIEDIEDSDPGDEYLDARVKVLSEMIKHHVKEEEQPGGMFDEARRADMDLAELGAELERRKLELMDDADTDAGYDEAAASDEDSDEDDDEDDDEDEDDDLDQELDEDEDDDEERTR